MSKRLHYAKLLLPTLLGAASSAQEGSVPLDRTQALASEARKGLAELGSLFQGLVVVGRAVSSRGPDLGLETAKEPIAEWTQDTEYQFAWASNGDSRYWEYLGLGGTAHGTHAVSWFDGVKWYQFGPGNWLGGISTRPPAGSLYFPDHLVLTPLGIDIAGLLLSPLTSLSVDESNEHLVTARLESPSRRAPTEVVLDRSRGWLPTRVARGRGDTLELEYVVRETTRVRQGLWLPTAFQFRKMAGPQTRGLSWDVTQSVVDLSLSDLNSLTACSFPPGVYLDDTFTRSYLVSGDTPEDAYTAWVAGRLHQAGDSGRELYWKRRIAECTHSQLHAYPVEQIAANASGQCGPVALIALFGALGVPPPTLRDAARQCGTSSDGTQIQGVIDCAERYGVQLIVSEFTQESAAELECPFLAVTKLADGNSHLSLFLPVVETHGTDWQVLDFPSPPYRWSPKRPFDGWTGVCVFPDTHESRQVVNRRPQESRKKWILAGTAAIGGAISALLVVRWHAVRRGLFRFTGTVLFLLIAGVSSCGEVTEVRELSNHVQLLPIWKSLPPTDVPCAIKCELQIVNRAASQAVLDAVVVSCGASIDFVPGQQIEPGESLKGNLRFMLHDPGQRSVRVVVRGSIDERNERFECASGISIVGNDVLVLDPPRVRLDADGTASFRVQHVMGPGGSAWTATCAEPLPGGLDCDVHRVAEGIDYLGLATETFAGRVQSRGGTRGNVTIRVDFSGAGRERVRSVEVPVIVERGEY